MSLDEKVVKELDFFAKLQSREGDALALGYINNLPVRNGEYLRAAYVRDYFERKRHYKELAKVEGKYGHGV